MHRPVRETVLLAVGAAVALLLQIALAPNIAILGAMPNIALVYAAVAAMLRSADSVLVCAFLLGLACDLVGNSAVGVMAALLLLAAFAASRAAATFGGETLAVSLAIAMVCSLVVEVAYATYYAAAAGAPFFDAVLMRALPCALYDCAAALIVYPLLSHLFAAAAPSHKAPRSSTVRLR